MVARFIFRSIQKFFFVWKDYSAGLVVKEQRSRAALIVFSRSANSLYKTGIFSAFTKAFMLWKFMAKAELTAAIQEISHLARGKQSKAVAILERAILHWSHVQLAHCWKKWNRCIVLAKSRIKAQKSAFTSMHRVRNHVLLAALYRAFSVWRQISISDKTVVKLHAISTCMLIKCSTKYARRFIMDRFQKWKATTAAMQIFESTFKAAVCTLESVYTKTFLRQAVQMWKQIVQRQASKQQLFMRIHSKLERFAQDETKRMFLTWKAVAYDLLKVNLLNDLERAKLAACLGRLEKCVSKLLRYSYCKAFNSWKFSALLHGKAFHYKRLFAAQRMVQVLCGSSNKVFLKCFKLWAFSSKLQKQDSLHTQQLLEIHQQHGLENLALKITQSMKLTLKILLNHVDKCLITYFLKWVQISKYLGALDEKRKKALSGIMQLNLNAQRLLLLKTVLTWKIGCMKDQLSIITHQRQRAVEAAKSNAAQVLARVYAEKESFCLAIALQKWHEQTITFQRMQHGSRLLFKFVQRLLHSSVYEALQKWKTVSERLKSRENLQSSQVEQASKLLFWLLQTRSKSTLRKGFATWCINIKISDKLAVYKLKYSYFFQVLQKWASKQRENVVRAWTKWRTATEKAKLSVVLAFNKRERSAMMLTALLMRKSTHALASAIYDWRMYIHLQRTFGVEFIDRALILIRISKRMEHRLLLIFLKRWGNAAERKALNKWHEKRNLLEKSKLLREFRAQSLYRVLLKFTHNCSTKRICRAFMALQAASLLNRAENCLDIIHQGRLLKITSQCQRSACKMMDVAVQRLLVKQMYVAWQKWSSFWRRRDRIKRCLKNLIAHMRESRLYWAFDEWKAFCLAHWIETQKTALRRHQTLALGLEAMSPWAFRNKILKKVGGFQALQVLSEEGKQVAQNDADRLPLVLAAFLTRSNHAAINKCWLKWKVATFLMKATNERYQTDALKFLRHEEQKLKAAF